MDNIQEKSKLKNDLSAFLLLDNSETMQEGQI
jgi:hypothetical protein